MDSRDLALQDCHIIGTANGVFVTRSTRRLPDTFKLEMLSDLVTSPWECGYANLGHRLVHAKRSSLPVVVQWEVNFRLETEMH